MERDYCLHGGLLVSPRGLKGVNTRTGHSGTLWSPVYRPDK
jgi:hypothetical protein